MQQVELWVDGRQFINKQVMKNEVGLRLMVNGDTLFERTVKQAQHKQPEQVGAQVLAYATGMPGEIRLTKIDGNRWASQQTYSNGSRQVSHVFNWHELAVVKVLSHGPEEEEGPEFEEPTGYGVVVVTDDQDCNPDGGVFVKVSEDRWVCTSCGDEVPWEDVISTNWEVVQEGWVA